MNAILTKINKICRVCLMEESLMHTIFDKNVSKDDISQKLMKCADVKIDANDNLPQLVCNKCLERLQAAYEFKQECEQSDQTLRKRILENEEETGSSESSLNALKFIKTEINEDSKYEKKEIIYNESEFHISESNSDSEDNINLLERKQKLRKNNENPKIIKTKKKANKRITAYKCKICNQTFREHARFWKHREKEKHLYYNCYVCWKQHPDIDTLKEHSLEHKNHLFICDQEDCDKEFDNFLLFTFHKKDYHAVENYLQCLECNKAFSCHEQWDIHVQKHLSKPFECKSCEEKFLTNMQFQEHIKIHPDYFNCLICGRQCKDQAAFDRHKKMHEGSFVCEECGKQFANKPNLKMHINVQHKGLPGRKETYKKTQLCPLCGKVFRRPCNLQHHMQGHAGIKSFACNYCEYRSNSKVHLANHIRTHTGEKPYACEFCGKAFACRSYLTVHRRFHTGERPYKCSFASCGKGFTTTRDLKVHERTHTGVKKFHCLICNNSFTTLHYLKVHIKNHNNK